MTGQPNDFALPEHPCNFIAYTALPVQVPHPESGEGVDGFRPQIFVREYPSILVKKVEVKPYPGGKDGETFGYVTFDAVSTGMENFTRDFSASVETTGDALAMLQRAQSEGLPVYVALETIRRAKGKGGNTAIDPTTPIHELRGAQPDGQKGNSNQTGDNCRNVLVAVAPAGHVNHLVVTSEARSGVAEWPSLRRNKTGALAPAGHRVFANGVIPNGAASAGPALDMEALAAAIVALLPGLGAAAAPGAVAPQSGSPAAAPMVRPPVRRAHAIENQPWKPWNTDGRLNLSSYPVGKERAAFRDAVTLLAATGPTDPATLLVEAWTLSGVLLWMADKVQSTVSGVAADRTEGSHNHAAQWVKYVYTELSNLPGFEKYAYTPNHRADREAANVWVMAVCEAASGLYGRAVNNVSQLLAPGEPVPFPPQPPTEAPAADAATVQSPTAAPAPAAPADAASAAVTRARGTAAENMKVTDSASLTSRYETLLATVGEAAHPERFAPLLSNMFGSSILSGIPAPAFAQALPGWEADPAAFAKAAQDAFRKVA